MSTSYHTQLIQKIQRTDYGQRAASQLLLLPVALPAAAAGAEPGNDNDNDNSSRHRRDVAADFGNAFVSCSSPVRALLGRARLRALVARVFVLVLVANVPVSPRLGLARLRLGCTGCASARFASVRFGWRQSLPVDCDVSTWRTAEQHAVKGRTACLCVCVCVGVCINVLCVLFKKAA